MSDQLRVVVADDEPDIREYLERAVPRLGHILAASAANGTELVEKCRETTPDLIITDIRMPDLDGIEAARIIYEECRIPAILISAYNDPELIARAKSDHVVCYLVKPIRLHDLETAIGKARMFTRQARDAGEDPQL